MRANLKVCVVAGLFLVATGIAPAATAAAASPVAAAVATADDCTGAGDGYGGEQPCEVELTTLQPVCDGDVPRLRYDVAAGAAAGQRVDITFVNPAGDDVVHADQPLSGAVLWPGAVVDASGAAVDWPGWRLVDGTWVVGDEYDWVRPSVEVRFALDATPAASAVVAYPPSAPACLTEPERSDVLVAGDVPAARPAVRAEVLSQTGVTSGPVVLISAGLVLAGVGGVMAARGRRP